MVKPFLVGEQNFTFNWMRGPKTKGLINDNLNILLNYKLYVYTQINSNSNIQLFTHKIVFIFY